MANYTQTTFFAPKDALAPGNPNKVIKGAEFDPEFSAISVAIATKVDTAGTGLGLSTTTLNLDFSGLSTIAPATGDFIPFSDTTDSDAIRRATPDGLATLFAGTTAATGLSATAAVLTVDINAMTAEATLDGANDTVLFYDDSAGALRKALIADLAAASTVPTSRQVIAGTGMVGGGDLTADRTFNVIGATGILAAADEILLDTSHVRNVDHSAVTFTAGTGLDGGGTLEANRTFDLDISGLTAVEIDDLVDTDGMLWDDGGVMKRMAYSRTGTRVTTASTKTVGFSDGNTWARNTGVSDFTVTIPPNATTAFPIGVEMGWGVESTGNITIAEGAGVTIVAAFSFKTINNAGDGMVIRKVATDIWHLTGGTAT